MEYWQLRTGISGVIFYVLCRDHDDFKELVRASGLADDPGKNYGQPFSKAEIPVKADERGIYRPDGRVYYKPE